MNKTKLVNWLPALVMMGIIFWFSSQPADELPVFSWADVIVKKSGHVIGYALLALSSWHAMAMDMAKNKRWLVWLFVILYALTDEYHQAFVAGRHSSIWDVLIFDNFGAVIALWLAGKRIKQKRPDQMSDRETTNL